MTIVATNLLSLGEVARELQAPCSAVVKAAAAAGVQPVMTIDRVPHFSTDDLALITDQLSKAADQRRIAAQN